jgi:hypothetical protein
MIRIECDRDRCEANTELSLNIVHPGGAFAALRIAVAQSGFILVETLDEFAVFCSWRHLAEYAAERHLARPDITEKATA